MVFVRGAFQEHSQTLCIQWLRFCASAANSSLISQHISLLATLHLTTQAVNSLPLPRLPSTHSSINNFSRPSSFFLVCPKYLNLNIKFCVLCVVSVLFYSYLMNKTTCLTMGQWIATIPLPHTWESSTRMVHLLSFAMENTHSRSTWSACLKIQRI